MRDKSLKNKVVFAIPKKGRLYDDTTKYLLKAGFNFRRSHRRDFAFCISIPKIAIFFLPAKDIASFVGKGDVDLGITGLDIIEESKIKVNKLMSFDYGKCDLCLQAPDGGINKPGDIKGKKIVTSFPNIAKKYISKMGIKQDASILSVSGSAEISCQLGLADAVIDLVQTGETMRAAGLKLVDKIMESAPFLISNPNSIHLDMINLIKRRLGGIKIAEKYIMIEYNIEKDNLKKAKNITPGYQSPTILQLEDKKWVAVKSMALKADVNKMLDDLEEIGATAILVYGIDNCRF